MEGSFQNAYAVSIVCYFHACCCFWSPSTVGLFARLPSSQPKPVPSSSPTTVCLDQTCTSHSLDTSDMSEAARNLPTSPSSLVVKEEPCDMDTVLIKWEMSEERIGEHQGSTGSLGQDEETPGLKSNVSSFSFLLFFIPVLLSHVL